MLYAFVDGIKRKAAPGLVALCPDCDGELRPKCGEIVVHHWAHVSTEDCDAWSTGETAWHLDWKGRFHPSQVEIRRECRTFNGAEWITERHRADVVSHTGCVIELQSSHLSPPEIRTRENFYEDMVWVFNATDPYAAGRLDIVDRSGYATFKWNHPRRSTAACTAPVFLDVDAARLLEVRRLYTDKTFFSGWGLWWARGDFVALHATHRAPDDKVALREVAGETAA